MDGTPSLADEHSGGNLLVVALAPCGIPVGIQIDCESCVVPAADVTAFLAGDERPGCLLRGRALHCGQNPRAVPRRHRVRRRCQQNAQRQDCRYRR